MSEFPVVDKDGNQIGTMSELILTERGVEAIIDIPYSEATEALFRDNVAHFSVGPYPVGPLTRAKNILDDVSPYVQQTFDSQVIPYLDHN